MISGPDPDSPTEPTWALKRPAAAELERMIHLTGRPVARWGTTVSYVGVAEPNMEGPSLIAACTTAFAMVFTLLAVLALVIRLVTLVFPVRAPRTDPAVVAAIAATVATQQPGARVVEIVEAP